MKSDALIIQQATSAHTFLLDLTHKDHSDYARKWSFDFWDIRADVTDGKHAFWNKVSLIIKGIEAGYQKIIWLDSDAYIADAGKDLREACPADGLGMTWHDRDDWGDERLYDHYNAGVIYLGVGDKCKRFLRVWSNTKDDNHPWHDQHSCYLAYMAVYQQVWKSEPPIYRLGHEWNATPFYPHDAPIVAAWHGCFPDIDRRLDLMQRFIQGNQMRRLVEGCDLAEATQKAEFCLMHGNFEAALKFIERAHDFAGDTKQYFQDLGACYYKLKQWQKAIDAYLKVLEYEPTDGVYWQSLSSCYDYLGEHEKNGIAIRRAFECNPNWPPAMHNLCLWQLRDGQWKAGLENLKWQFLVRERIARCPGEEWDGTYIRTPDRQKPPVLFIWCEQGLGDTLMLSRYVRGVNEIWPDCKIIFEVQKPLARLFEAQCWPNVQIVAHEPEKGVPFDYDAHIGMFSLPSRFLVEKPYDVQHPRGLVTSIYREYLKAPAESAEKVKPRFPSQINGLTFLRVGFSWAGSSGHGNNANRNMQAGTFDEIVKTPGTRWYSLQRDIVIPDEAKETTPEVEYIGDEPADMADVAGILANLDLVITIDSAIAHLCGAMGIPCWILLSKSSDWRWLTAGSSTVWYQSCRLFRQETLGAWDEVMQEVQDALKARLDNG